MRKNLISSVIVLCSICLAFSLILGITYLSTKDRIEENQLKKEENLRKQLLPSEENFSKVVDEEFEEGIKEVWKSKAGWVISYKIDDETLLIAGIDKNGAINSVLKREISDSGIVKNIVKDTYYNQYKGLSNLTLSKFKNNLDQRNNDDSLFNCIALLLNQIEKLSEGDL